MIAAWLAASAAAIPGSACGPHPSEDVDNAAAAIDAAFRSADEASFDRASKSFAAAISCLDVVPDPAQVGRIHEAMALASYVNGQLRACRRSLAAARLLDPSWKLPDEEFPPTHPYRDLFAAATDPGPVEDIGKITPDDWVVDGVVRDEAPTERGFLLQVQENGAIVWSGYLWDFDEIPDRGQARDRSPLEAPHRWWLAGRVHGAGLFENQRPRPGASAWSPQSGTAFGGGGELALRYTPVTVIGFDAAASLTGPSDPILEGGGLPLGHGALLLGGAGWIKGTQPYAAARIGGEIERLRVWPSGLPHQPPELQLYTVPLLLAGAEVGLRSEHRRLDAAFDGFVGRQWTPYAWRAEIDGGAIVNGPLAIEGAVSFRRARTPETDNGTFVGVRQESDLRIGGGVALWY